MRKPNFERLLKVLWLDGEPDYIPYYELFADQEVMEAITGEYFSREGSLQISGVELHAAQLNEKMQHNLKIVIKFYRILGYDYVPLEIPSFLYRNNILLAEDTAPIPHIKRVWLDENRGYIQNREDFNKYRWPDLSIIQETFLSYYEFVKKNLPNEMMIGANPAGGILENVMWLMGTIPFFKALYIDPALIGDMFEKIGNLISFCCELAAELDAVGAIAMGDDMGYKTGPMIHPDLLRKYVFPWQKKCVENAHKHGKPFILHACGKLDLVMNDLIDYVGIDAKHSYEDSSYPVIEYKKAYGERIAILGGVDMDKLSRMPKNDFQQYVKDIISECAPGGGYALGCGNTAANYIKLENYLTMLEIGKKYGKYPLT